MQLEQQETFEIKGPQLEVFGEVESRLPAPAKKRPVAALVLAAAVLVSVFGVGGLRLRALYNDTLSVFSAADEYGHGIQTDLAVQADAAASMIRVAGGVLGEEEAAVTAAQDSLDAWNAQADPRDPAGEYALNVRMYGAVDQLYTTAYAEADDKRRGQLDDLYDQFLSAQATIDRAGAAYNAEAAAYNTQAHRFPANLIAALWGADELEAFAPAP